MLKTLDLSKAVEEFHVSQISFGESWAEASCNEEGSFSLDDESVSCHHEKIRQMCDCIDSALAVVSSPSTTQRKGPTQDQSSSPVGADTPPSRPRRSFDVGKRFSLLRAKSAGGHDRFRLSKSEHRSQSFKAPKKPFRLESEVEGEDDAQTVSSSRRPSLDEPPKSSRDVMMVPPARTSSGFADDKVATTKQRGRRRNKTLSPPRNLLTPEVTLRSPEGRVLRASRELSTSDHLRRSPPRTPRVVPTN